MVREQFGGKEDASVCNAVVQIRPGGMKVYTHVKTHEFHGEPWDAVVGQVRKPCRGETEIQRSKIVRSSAAQDGLAMRTVGSRSSDIDCTLPQIRAFGRERAKIARRRCIRNGEKSGTNVREVVVSIRPALAPSVCLDNSGVLDAEGRERLLVKICVRGHLSRF